MKIKIQETAITDFKSIAIIANSKTQLSSNLVDFHHSLPQIIKEFENLAHSRPLLKKPGIKVNIQFLNPNSLSWQDYQQLLFEYLQEIGWNDLQYVSYIHIGSDVEIETIFNRIISKNRIISLRCLGANWQQYKIIEESYHKILQSHFPHLQLLMA